MTGLAMKFRFKGAAMDIRAAARALDGEVSGAQILAPGPGHSREDRSLAVRLDTSAPDGFIVHRFAGDNPITCRDYVRQRVGMPVFKPNGYKAARREPEPSQTDNHETAKWLWERRRPITDDCPAGKYLRRRRACHGPVPATLGYLPAAGKHPAAMVAAFGFCSEPEPGMIRPPSPVASIHLTRLTPDGEKAGNDSKPTKIMLGLMSGLPIVLAPVNDGLGLAIVEGIEDGLSVFEETGLGVWAAGSAPNLPKIAAAIPQYVECVTIFAHRDKGMRFAKEAARLIAAMKVECHLKGRG
jgi:Toprim domain